MNNYSLGQGLPFNNGTSQNLSYQIIVSRNSISQPLYPRWGSEIRLSLRLTPPYSLFSNIDYANPDILPETKYKRIEFYKVKFVVNWFTEILPKLVLKTSAGFGFLGHYNDDIGTAPFERFFLGGSALSNVQFISRENVALRGYDEGSLSPPAGASAIAKYVIELRYPIVLSQATTIYALTFFEAGNTWTNGSSYSPLNMFHSTGIGLRVFLPAFGLLGLDYGWRLNDVPFFPFMAKGQFHFTIGMNVGDL